jgi:hypothetical protein
MIRRTRHVLAKQIGIVITALAVVAGLMSVGAAAQAVERPPMAGPPGVEITSPVVDDPVTGEAGTPATVSFTTNRAWPYIVDFRAAEVGDEWLPFADDTGSGTARAGDNEVEVEIPADLADGEYDVRVRILTPGGNPDRRQVMAEAEVESGLHVLPDAQPVVESVTVSPSAASLDVGDTAALSATARYDDESEQDVTAEAEWTSNDEAVASVDPEGLVTAVGAGTAEITATFEGAAGSATVTVDTSPDVFTTDFKEADQVAGEAPAGWTQLWGDGGFEIADAPRRVVHANTESGQGAIVFDAAGVIDYDVDAEVAGLVRLPAASNPSGTSTRFQMHLQASGDSGDHYSFYTDATGASVRLGRYLGGSYTGRGTAYSYAVPADAWPQSLPGVGIGTGGVPRRTTRPAPTGRSPRRRHDGRRRGPAWSWTPERPRRHARQARSQRMDRRRSRVLRHSAGLRCRSCPSGRRPPTCAASRPATPSVPAGHVPPARWYAPGVTNEPTVSSAHGREPVHLQVLR